MTTGFTFRTLGPVLAFATVASAQTPAVHTVRGTVLSAVGHPVAGASWEGFVIETLIAAAPEETQANFYRTAAGAEIDLLLRSPRGDLWAIEVKRSLAPSLERGFHHACADLKPQRRIVVYPGAETYPLGHDVEVMPLQKASAAIAEID